jgi:predicted lipoprotein with Yx(FWY)xxD motif/cytochrome c2
MRWRNDGRSLTGGSPQVAILLLALVMTTSAAVASGATSRVGSPGAAPVVRPGPTSILGKILVDASGHSLYTFTGDRDGRSTCYGACARVWLPVFVVDKGRARGGADAMLLGRTQRKDGRFQLTYGKHPLYLSKLDAGAGELNGQARSAFGGKWYLLSPAGRIIQKAVPKAKTTTPPSKSTTTPSTTTSRPPTFPLGDPSVGASVFASAGCGNCHTLAAAHSNGTVGPDLDALKPSLAATQNKVYYGGDHMPDFARTLTLQQIANVAAFVYQSTAQAA